MLDDWEEFHFRRYQQISGTGRHIALVKSQNESEEKKSQVSVLN
jgi:hypothetical protein